ncbi:hypothetical protein MHU86_12528 [Fragilaria crotonensis]|nr:hypothetical protein MHU86_12528 [Fragilaria crotonensis]
MLPCKAQQKVRPITLRPDGVGATLEDLPPAVFPLQCVQDLFTFSPFGLSCRQCEKQVQIKFDERCIRDHLKKHCMESRMSTVRSLLLGFSKRVNVIKATGNIDPFRHDDKTYIGCLCVCGQSFPRKDNALRHCKQSTCDDSQLQKVELIRLCCGRYVSHAQVSAFFNEAPRITEQFDYGEARAVLLPLLPQREKQDDTYTHMFTPLISGCGGGRRFVEKIKTDFNFIHSPPNPLTEVFLVKLHQLAEVWLLNYAQKNIKMVPGDLRAALQTFEGGEIEDVSQRCTYAMQHDPSTLLFELKKLLSYLFRRGLFANKQFNHQDGFSIAYFLKDLMLEIPPSVQHHPLAVEFCLMSGFRVQKEDSKIKMISCDTVSSLIAKVTSILKAGICSVICSFSEDAFTLHGPALITAVRKSHVLHSLSPMLRQIREMHRRLPKRRKTTLDEKGNIVVDQFSFLFDVWSQIVPKTVYLMKVAISNLAEGTWWEPVVNVLSNIKVHVDCDTGDLFLRT